MSLPVPRWPLHLLSHDLRNPLTAIHASAEMLVHSTLTDVQVRRIARNMYGASVRMKILLDEFVSPLRWIATGTEPTISSKAGY
jgi:signal transduction histidine kinase